MNTEFISALKQIEKERNIPLEMLIRALEDALGAAYKRNFGPNQNIIVEIDRATGAMKVFARKTVVLEVSEEQTELSLDDARQIDDSAQEGDEVLIEVTPTDFGRIAAQTAKQVIVQRIRETERDIIYGEFTKREGDIVSGIVQRYEQRNVLVDLGKAEGVLALSEQAPHEHFRHGERCKAYVLEVKRTARGPQVMLSRTHPGLLKRLFEIEVPEIRQGVISIKAVVREPGYRAKMAVKSNDSSVDPVGACVGPRGSRVQSVSDELRGEKIDLIPWNQDQTVFVANALSPARVIQVLLNDPEKSALVITPDAQLSLAIGKEGQNARLAAKLTGWRIDIKSESQAKEMARDEAARRAQQEADDEQRRQDEARMSAERAHHGVAEPQVAPQTEQPYAEPAYPYAEGQVYPEGAVYYEEETQYAPAEGQTTYEEPEPETYSQMVWDEASQTFVEFVPGQVAEPVPVMVDEPVGATAATADPGQGAKRDKTDAKPVKKKLSKDKKKRIEDLQEEYGDDFEAP
ncbi:MAG TPA: transcription termination factor NusA [Candidatus Xenobia bacterium]